MTTKIIIAIVALTIGLLVGSRFMARPALWTAQPTTTAGPAAATSEDSFTTPISTVPATPSALCTAPPETSDIGRAEYPTDPKYGQLSFLGQLFTAADCGPERVKNIFGVSGDRYTLGSAVYLKNDVPVPLAQALARAGFSCKNNNATPVCRTWILPNDVSLDSLLTLRAAAVQFADSIERDDCVNCG